MTLNPCPSLHDGDGKVAGETAASGAMSCSQSAAVDTRFVSMKTGRGWKWVCQMNLFHSWDDCNLYPTIYMYYYL
jgi:hypothetical protein